MSFGIGDTVGTYKIVAAIGAGGMGEVFRVEHVVTNRVEAMKILAAATSSSPEQDQRFLREIQLQELRNDISQGLASLDRGEGIGGEEALSEMQTLSAEYRRRNPS